MHAITKVSIQEAPAISRKDTKVTGQHKEGTFEEALGVLHRTVFLSIPHYTLFKVFFIRQQSERGSTKESICMLEDY